MNSCSYPLSKLGKVVDKRGVNPAYPSPPTLTTYKVVIAGGVYLIYRVINEYLLGSWVLSGRVRQLTELQNCENPEGVRTLSVKGYDLLGFARFLTSCLVELYPSWYPFQPIGLRLLSWVLNIKFKQGFFESFFVMLATL